MANVQATQPLHVSIKSGNKIQPYFSLTADVQPGSPHTKHYRKMYKTRPYMDILLSFPLVYTNPCNPFTHITYFLSVPDLKHTQFLPIKLHIRTELTPVELRYNFKSKVLTLKKLPLNITGLFYHYQPLSTPAPSEVLPVESKLT